MRAEFEKFNAEHVGEDSVFPTKNGAPKILEQFKDKPYTLELRDEFTTGNKPKSLIANNQGNTLSWQTRHMQGARALRSHHTSGWEMWWPEMFLEIGNRTKERAWLYQGVASYIISRHYGRVDQPLFETSSKHATSRNWRD